MKRKELKEAIKRSLREALDLKTAKEYTKHSEGFYKKVLPQLFGKKHRLYFPISFNVDVDSSLTFKKVKDYLPDLTVDDYIQNKISVGKQTFKLSKALAKVLTHKLEFNTLVKAIQMDPLRAGKDQEFEIVISRHPYDIAGMSSDRNWTSCMNLGTCGIVYKDKKQSSHGKQKYVQAAVKKGTLIAYLITKDDKNIQRPLARVSVLPYTAGKEVYYSVSDKMYGQTKDDDKFQKEVQKILDDKVNKALKNVIFKMKPGIYKDGNYSTLTHLSSDIKGFIEKNKDDKKLLWSLWVKATREGNIEAVKHLLDAGININKNNSTALSNAAEHGHVELMQFLVDNGAKLRPGILIDPVDNRNLDAVKYLVDLGADVNDEYGSVLDVAAENGDLPMVKYLVDQGAKLESEDENHHSPLSSAASEGHFDVVKYLVEKGADVEDRGDGFPLRISAYIGHLPMVKYLISKGADIYRTDLEGESALDWSIEGKRDNVTEYLRSLMKKSKINESMSLDGYQFQYTEPAGKKKGREYLTEEDYANFEIHDVLNQKLYVNESLLPEVRKKLMKIAAEFIKFIKVKAPIKDIIITGSSSNFNYSDKYSDIDLHIVYDFADIDDNVELVKEYLNAKKTLWNEEYDITINGIEVELYAQDSEEPHEATGVYSLLRDKWVRKPSKIDVELDISGAEKKADALMDFIDRQLGAKECKSDCLNKIKDKIKKMRKAGLDSKEGEFSTENLAFKILRRSGYIQKVWDAETQNYEDELSLK
jgi:ankyrin repeat protein